MNKAQANREACGVLSLLIQQYVDSGQPADDMLRLYGKDEMHPDTKRLRAAFVQLRDEMKRRGDAALLRLGRGR